VNTRPIVVGVDGSEGSKAALDWAIATAAAFDAPMRLVDAFSPWAGWTLALPSFDFNDFKATLESDLAECCQRVKKAGIDHVCNLVEDEPASAILKDAQRADALLIVLGAHGHSMWSMHLLGSVTAKILHHTSLPVAVVPEKAPEPTDRGIVVGVDGSPTSRRALRWAADFAAATGETIRAITVAPAEIWHEQPSFSNSGDVDIVRGLSNIAWTVSDETGVPIDTEAIVGDPATELVRLSARTDLMVLGSRGHTSIGEVMFGSVGRHCATHSSRPVVIIPASNGAAEGEQNPVSGDTP
jgi:nucleotide-binding universal stress UspA family protein